MAVSLTSGTTAKSTASDAAITLVTVPSDQKPTRLTITNEGDAPGFFAVDGGLADASWERIEARLKMVDLQRSITGNVVFKRVAGGSNCTGLYAALS